jgi:Anaerobic dehydrogenases, typically selenocysteine-containing
MAQLIIHEHRYNHDFARKYIQGLDTFKAMLDKSYTPEKAASITGLDSEIIRFLAKDFTQAKKPSCPVW